MGYFDQMSLIRGNMLDSASSLPLLKDCYCQYGYNVKEFEFCQECANTGQVPTEMGKSIIDLFRNVALREAYEPTTKKPMCSVSVRNLDDRESHPEDSVQD